MTYRERALQVLDQLEGYVTEGEWTRFVTNKLGDVAQTEYEEGDPSIYHIPVTVIIDLGIESQVEFWSNAGGTDPEASIRDIRRMIDEVWPQE